MRKKKDSLESQPEVQSEEAKKFQSLVNKILSVPKSEIDKREIGYQKKKSQNS